MLSLRPALPSDLDYLIAGDLRDEGTTFLSPRLFTGQILLEHRRKIESFITGPADAAWVIQDTSPVGAILVRFRDRLHEPATEANEFLFRFLPSDWAPPDGRFCEIYNLWVDPPYRRQGLATRLKRHIETESLQRGIRLIYTHTEERNTHVLALNEKLGYREIRRGPLWDDIIRVSLIKSLPG